MCRSRWSRSPLFARASTVARLPVAVRADRPIRGITRQNRCSAGTPAHPFWMRKDPPRLADPGDPDGRRPHERGSGEPSTVVVNPVDGHIGRPGRVGPPGAPRSGLLRPVRADRVDAYGGAVGDAVDAAFAVLAVSAAVARYAAEAAAGRNRV